MSHLTLPVCVRARGEVSSSNKRKVALRIFLLLPHADHHNLPPSPLLSYRSSSSFSSTTASCSSTAVSSASLPRNRAYLSLRSCKQSNSKLPAIVTHGVTVTTEPGEALRIAEEKDVKERMGKGKEERSDPLRGTLEAEVSTHLIGSRLWCEKIPAKVEERVRSKIGRDRRKITNEIEEMIKNFVNIREHSMIWMYMMIESNRPVEEREKIAHFRYPPLCFPIFRSLTRYRRTGEMDRIWTIPPLFKTDEELSGRSLCLWWTRCAVRGYGGSPRPPIGRERRDREQYRHEGTNYPPTITTTIRTRPPPPSAATPRFDVRDEEGRTETELAWTRTAWCWETVTGKEK